MATQTLSRCPICGQPADDLTGSDQVWTFRCSSHGTFSLAPNTWPRFRELLLREREDALTRARQASLGDSPPLIEHIHFVGSAASFPSRRNDALATGVSPYMEAPFSESSRPLQRGMRLEVQIDDDLLEPLDRWLAAHPKTCSSRPAAVRLALRQWLIQQGLLPRRDHRDGG